MGDGPGEAWWAGEEMFHEGVLLAFFQEKGRGWSGMGSVQRDGRGESEGRVD